MSTVKLEGWTPQAEPPEELKRELRQLVKRAVYGHWYEKTLLLGHEPEDLSLEEIDLKVQTLIASLKSDGKWRWGSLKIRTIDRRTNETASEKYAGEFGGGVVPIVSTRAGYYRPNPERWLK